MCESDVAGDSCNCSQSSSLSLSSHQPANHIYPPTQALLLPPSLPISLAPFLSSHQPVISTLLSSPCTSPSLHCDVQGWSLTPLLTPGRGSLYLIFSQKQLGENLWGLIEYSYVTPAILMCIGDHMTSQLPLALGLMWY